jgi:hypothetical protein
MTNDGYINGPHNFWIHFLCGFVFGTLISGWLSLQVSESPGFIVIGTFLGALVIAYSCGRWGDSAWHWLLRRVASLN